MKKIFTLLMAAALIGCTNDTTETLTPEGKLYSAPLTVKLSAPNTRSFDSEMNWEWSDTDQIRAFQAADTRITNILEHSGEGVFTTEEFSYSSSEAADFHFVYGGSITHLNSYTDSYITPSHGATWTPILYGKAESTTIDAISEVELEAVSAALEIRVWANDKTSRKEVYQAKLSADQPFCGRWNATTGEPTLEDNSVTANCREQSDVVFFNLPAGSYTKDQLTLKLSVGTPIYVDIPMGGGSGSTTITGTPKTQTTTISLPAFELVTGKRTVVNVALDTSQAIITSAQNFNNLVTTYIGTATKIKFVGNSSVTSDIEMDNCVTGLGAYLVLSEDGTTAEIHTPADEFIMADNQKNAIHMLFYALSDLTSIDFGDNFNASNITYLGGFNYNSKLETVSFGKKFDTSNITSMRYLFANCTSLTSVFFGEKFTTSNVTNMEYMFSECSTLGDLDLSHFNTDNVTTMERMFNRCEALTEVDLSSFNTSKVTTMGGMFQYCTSLKEVDLSNFDFSHAPKVSSMFSYGGAFTVKMTAEGKEFFETNDQSEGGTLTIETVE